MGRKQQLAANQAGTAAGTAAAATAVSNNTGDTMETTVTAEAVAEMERKRAILAAAYLELQAAEDAQLAEVERAAAAEKSINYLIRVLAEVQKAAQFQHETYRYVLCDQLAGKLESAEEISAHIIATVAAWPMSKDKSRQLGIQAAAKDGFVPAMALAAFNVWRSNYTRGFDVIGKALCALFKTAEKLTKDDTYKPEHGTLKRAIAEADNLYKGRRLAEVAEEVAETLQEAITCAQERATARAEEKAAEKAEEEAAEAEQLAARINNLETASLARVMRSVLQLAANNQLDTAEKGLLLAAGARLAGRVKAAAEAAEATQEAAEAAVEVAADTEIHPTAAHVLSQLAAGTARVNAG